jgi:hypothetical protein
LVIAIPVLLISVLSIAVYYFGSKIISLFRKTGNAEEKIYSLEIPLIKTGSWISAW